MEDLVLALGNLLPHREGGFAVSPHPFDGVEIIRLTGHHRSIRLSQDGSNPCHALDRNDAEIAGSHTG
jgi:hypothetical protein